MYYYACPYCDPSSKAHLKIVITEAVGCKYDNEDVCEEKHKCKETMECKVCQNRFKITKSFLKSQKRKIKDG
jgi:tRNA(Ile)-lysidine synthase TilS/MesJ